MKSVVIASLFLAVSGSVAVAAPPKPAASSLAVTYHTLKRKKARRYEISVRYPVFAGTSPVVRLANTTLRTYAEKEVADFARQSDADWKEFGAENSPEAYDLEMKPTVSLARPDLISLQFERYMYMGGAHPNTEYPSMTFGIKNGQAKRLNLRDLFRAGFNPSGGLDKYLLPQLRKAQASLITDGEMKTLGKDQLGSWYVTPRGITFTFAPYVVASYAEGVFGAKVSFAELQSALDAEGPLRPVL